MSRARHGSARPRGTRTTLTVFASPRPHRARWPGSGRVQNLSATGSAEIPATGHDAQTKICQHFRHFIQENAWRRSELRQPLARLQIRSDPRTIAARLSKRNREPGMESTLSSLTMARPRPNMSTWKQRFVFLLQAFDFARARGPANNGMGHMMAPLLANPGVCDAPGR